jgi:hypothetical protein
MSIFSPHNTAVECINSGREILTFWQLFHFWFFSFWISKNKKVLFSQTQTGPILHI